MEDNQVSRTALIAAWMRAYHARHDDPKIVDDFLASCLLTGDEQVAMERHVARSLQTYDPVRAAGCPDQPTAVAWSMRCMPGPPFILARARYTEDNLEDAIRQGVRQYVILGAGLDTFAFRRPDLMERLRVFEVDHPATQAFKRRRIREAGWEEPGDLHFVPVDFTREDLAAGLAGSSYDTARPAFFSWMGVTYYLPKDSALATLKTIAGLAPVGSGVVFDYLDTDAFVPGRVVRRVQLWLDNVRRVGEPVYGGLDPDCLVADLAPLGLAMNEDLAPAEIEQPYFRERTDGYHATGHVHFARAVVVQPN